MDDAPTVVAAETYFGRDDALTVVAAETYFSRVETITDIILLMTASRAHWLHRRPDDNHGVPEGPDSGDRVPEHGAADDSPIRVHRKLNVVEKQTIRPGSVFIWKDDEIGMNTWVDGRTWRPVRRSTPGLHVFNQKRAVARRPALVKKAVNFRMPSLPPDANRFHLVCYCSANEPQYPPGLPQPSTDPRFSHITVTADMHGKWASALTRGALWAPVLAVPPSPTDTTRPADGTAPSADDTAPSAGFETEPVVRQDTQDTAPLTWTGRLADLEYTSI